MTGIQASMGAPGPAPMLSDSQPYWKIATIRPNEPATASRFMTAAVNGTTRLRNATISSTNDRPTTTAMNSGILRASTFAKSTLMAVSP